MLYIFCVVVSLKERITKKKTNTKQRQYELMVDFMLKHPDLAKGHLNVSNARSKSKDLWTRLCLDLDAAGPPTHDCTKWKKVWADYKNHIKVKCREHQNSISGTGGGPSKFCSLTQLEEKVVALLSIDKAVSGMDGTSHFGVNTQHNTTSTNNTGSHHQEDVTIMEEYLNVACDEADVNPIEHTLSHTPHRRSQKECVPNKEILLREQVENQIKFQENSVKLMSQMDQNLKSCVKTLTDVNQNLADVKKYFKRSCDWQERQYKLCKEKFEFKKRTELEKTKRKMMQLELKKQILDLKSEKHGISK